MSKSFNETIEAGILDLAWSLWTELGVQGVRRRHEGWAIDIESLIAFTAALGDLDPRLRDEATDWCIANHRYISSSRLKTVVASLSEYAAFIGEFIATVNAHSHARLAGGSSPRDFNPRGRANIDDIGRSALIRLRLRSLFGVGARAEIVHQFLSSPGASFSASDLAQRTAFTKRHLADALRDLEDGGLLKAIKKRNQLMYALQHGTALTEIVGTLPTHNPHWLTIVPYLLCIRSVSEQAPLAAFTSLRRLSTTLEVPLDPEPPFERKGKDFWPAFVAWAEEFIASLARPDVQFR